MPTLPMGAIYAGGRFEEFVIDSQTGEQYTILFLPDAANEQLQREGQPAYYYYVPKSIRLARKGDVGDYKFHHTHFVGTFDPSTHVGLGNGEVVGGVLAFTVTYGYPTAVLKQAEKQLIARCQGQLQGNKFWGLRSSAPPRIGICPMSSNRIAVTNLSPDAKGDLPTPTGGAPTGGELPGAPRSDLLIRRAELPQTVPHGRDFRAPSNLDAWAWNLQGATSGSAIGGESAYSGLIGGIPSEIIWAGFHGTYSPIVITQNLSLSVWADLAYLKITGNWDRIFEHFSAHAQGRYWWASGDIKAEFNNLRTSGGISVELMIDGTAPGAMDLEKELNKRIDLIYDRFMQEAAKVIFQPAPTVEPAQASGGSGWWFWSANFALKYRRDTTRLNLFYEERRRIRYREPHEISSSLEGFYNEIKANPDNERKYFTRLVLGDLSRKVTRIVRPVVNWKDDPIAFVTCQVGYPGSQGNIQWANQLFQEDTTWNPVMVERRKSEVTNPPQGWEPDKTFIKRKVHFKEPPREADSPFVHIFVENPVVEIDPGKNGSLNNDNTLEVRASDVGVLSVGPMQLGIELLSSAEVVEVEFQALNGDNTPRGAVTRFQWKYNDQNEPRIWKRFTGQKDYVPLWRYRVHCTVKGSFYSKGMAWSGPWTDGTGNGAFTITVPLPDDPGVTKRNLTVREMLSDELVRVADEGVSAPVAPPAGGGTAPPSPPVPAGGGMAPPPMGREPLVAGDRSVEGYDIGLPGVPPPIGRSPEPIGNGGVGREAPEPVEELELIGGWSPE
jgi:hypothetical protein